MDSDNHDNDNERGKKRNEISDDLSLASQLFLDSLYKIGQRRLRCICSKDNTTKQEVNILNNIDQERKTKSFLSDLEDIANSEVRKKPLRITSQKLPEGKRYKVPSWKRTSQNWMAFCYHLALLRAETDSDKVYCFTMHFNDSILAKAEASGAPLYYLSQRIGDKLKTPYYLRFERTKAGRWHIHGACLFNSRKRKELEQIFESIGLPSDEHKANFLRIKRNYNIANYSQYGCKEVERYNGEKTLRHSQLSGDASKIYNLIRSHNIIENRHNPKIWWSYRFALWKQHGYRPGGWYSECDWLVYKAEKEKKAKLSIKLRRAQAKMTAVKPRE